MNTNHIERHFDACNLPVQFVDQHPRKSAVHALNNPNIPLSLSHVFYVDVDTDRKRGEYFRVYGADNVELLLMDKQPKSRHLLLQMRAKLQIDAPPEKRHYLMGHDERQLFVVGADGISTVKDALSALKPRAVVQAEKRGLKVIRQGDWFFIPMTGNFDPGNIILQNTTLGGDRPHTLGITVGNPHVAEEQVIRINERNMGRNLMRRFVTIAVRGKIRHDEHSTVKLVTWHQAIQSRNPAFAEGVTIQSQSTLRNDSTIGYYD